MANESYVFRGSKKNPGDRTRAIHLEGSTPSNPVEDRILNRNGAAVELTEDEVTALRKQGWDLRKVNTDGSEDGDEKSPEEQAAEQLAAQAPPASVPAPVTEAGQKADKKR